MLKHKTDATKFYVFYRWGRVGLGGEWLLRGVFTEEKAIEAYRAKQKEKGCGGKYTTLEMSYLKDDPEILAKALAKTSNSKLPPSVARLIQLIFDFKMINNQMIEAGYDPKKLPLGKLSLNTINKAFDVLNKLSTAISNNEGEETLQQLSSEFYTLIPHDIGWQNMKTMTIRSAFTIREKLELLESLRQVQVAYQVAYGDGQDYEKEEKSAIDMNYEKLHCEIKPVDKEVILY